MKNSFAYLPRVFAASFAFAISQLSFGQLQTPAASPSAKLSQTVGLTEIEIDYSRPSVKGRAIFGGLVPFGSVWRTGANQPSKITFGDDVVMGGMEVPAGQYALYTIPEKDEWTVIVYSSTDLWGAMGYNEKDDLLRFKVKPLALSHVVESMAFSFDALTNDSGVLHLDWDRTRIAIPIQVPTASKVLAQIEALKDTPEFNKPNVLFSAATYYHESGKDLETAYAWVSKACEESEKPAYWMFARKAWIEVDLGLKSEAKESAEKTLQLATAGANADYQKIAKDILAAL